MEKPQIKEYGWTVYVPFTKQKNRYNKDYQRWELSLLDKNEQDIFKIRKNQLANINGVSALLIALITTIWGFYYQMPSGFQHTFEFMKMGLSTTPSWADHVFMFVVPGISGTVIHHVPKIVPGKKLKVVSELVIKIIPVIILIICFYLPHTQKQIKEIKRANKIANVIFNQNDSSDINKVTNNV